MAVPGPGVFAEKLQLIFQVSSPPGRGAAFCKPETLNSMASRGSQTCLLPGDLHW